MMSDDYLRIGVVTIFPFETIALASETNKASREGRERESFLPNTFLFI